MGPEAVVAIRRRLPAVPWTVPIAVHFACDDKPLFGCRLCILRYGLRRGDHSHLFDSEAAALAHIGSHTTAADRAAADRRAEPRIAGWPCGD